MTRVVRLDSFDDQLLRSQVGLGNKIDVTLVRDLKCSAQAIGENGARITSHLNSKVKQTFLFSWFVVELVWKGYIRSVVTRERTLVMDQVAIKQRAPL